MGSQKNYAPPNPQGGGKASWQSTDWNQWTDTQRNAFNKLGQTHGSGMQKYAMDYGSKGSLFQRNQHKILDSYNNSNNSIPDQMNQNNLDGPKFDTGYNQPNFYEKYDPGKKETNWWNKIGDTLGADGALGGIKGWLDLGVEGMKAWTGYQQVGLAREQNQLGRDAFGFQKAAWNKDYDARKIAYNTNARDVNAWKAAQTPGGYTMSELVV